MPISFIFTRHLVEFHSYQYVRYEAWRVRVDDKRKLEIWDSNEDFKTDFHMFLVSDTVLIALCLPFYHNAIFIIVQALTH